MFSLSLSLYVCVDIYISSLNHNYVLVASSSNRIPYPTPIDSIKVLTLCKIRNVYFWLPRAVWNLAVYTILIRCNANAPPNQVPKRHSLPLRCRLRPSTWLPSCSTCSEVSDWRSRRASVVRWLTGCVGREASTWLEKRFTEVVESCWKVV